MPQNVTYPGVFVEEIPEPPKPIEGVPTSITAFVGATKKGAMNRPMRVTHFAEFERQFGPHSAGLTTSYAVAQFFTNGGREAIIARIAKGASMAKTVAGIRALDAVDLFNLLVLPGHTAPAILAAAADYCRTRRAFFIADPPEKIATPAGMVAFVRSSAFRRSPNAAIYFPWTTVSDPLNNGHPRPLPPGGTIAGLIARTDATRGVWKSPAGPDASLIGVKSLAFLLDDDDSDPLNAAGVNCLRTFRTFGLVAWGARTLEGADELASDWKYVAVRRLGLFIEESIARGTQWAVFEPNAEPLWARLRMVVGDFLLKLHRDGALQGATAKQAFFVKCGVDTMTAADIAAGVINIEIGFAPLRPSEFVVIKIQRRIGQL